MARCVVSLPWLWLGVAAAAQAAPPPSVADRPHSLAYCYQDQFSLGSGPYQRATFGPGATRIDAGADCIKGELASCPTVPIDPAATWIAGARAGEWICVSDGKVFGWTALAGAKLEPAPPRPAADWLGDWARDEGSATVQIKAGKAGKALEISGEAEWRAGPDETPNLGDLEGDVSLEGVVLTVGRSECVGEDRMEKSLNVDGCIECNARLVLVGSTLVVTDNRHCGGMNVNFDGLYHRAAATPRKATGRSSR